MQAVSLVGCDSLFVCELIISQVQYSIAVQFRDVGRFRAHQRRHGKQVSQLSTIIDGLALLFFPGY